MAQHVERHVGHVLGQHVLSTAQIGERAATLDQIDRGARGGPELDHGHEILEAHAFGIARSADQLHGVADQCGVDVERARLSLIHISLARTPDAILRGLEWTVLRRLEGLLQGDYRTLFRGAGIDLSNLREYQDGDDVRYIDWNVTARLQTLHVREYQPVSYTHLDVYKRQGWNTDEPMPSRLAPTNSTG